MATAEIEQESKQDTQESGQTGVSGRVDEHGRIIVRMSS
jgi:hypothetical protein